jgi:hypothetical protein
VQLPHLLTYWGNISSPANKGTNSTAFQKSQESSDCHGKFGPMKNVFDIVIILVLWP